MMDASRVPIEIPPKVPLDGVDLIKVFGFFDISTIRVLSPNIDPPVTVSYTHLTLPTKA